MLHRKFIGAKPIDKLFEVFLTVQKVDQIDDACKTLFQVACGGRSKAKGCGSTRFRNKIMISKDVKEVRNDIQEPVTPSSSSSRCTIAVKV